MGYPKCLSITLVPWLQCLGFVPVFFKDVSLAMLVTPHLYKACCQKHLGVLTDFHSELVEKSFKFKDSQTLTESLWLSWTSAHQQRWHLDSKAEIHEIIVMLAQCFTINQAVCFLAFYFQPFHTCERKEFSALIPVKEKKNPDSLKSASSMHDSAAVLCIKTPI